MPTYSTNKKALFDYEVLEKFEAGLVLIGTEVKSIRNNTVSLKGAFVTLHNKTANLINVHIPKYKFTGNIDNYEPDRTRQLLLKAKEIDYLRGKSQEKGLTIVPISLYTKGRQIKLEIALVRGKKKFDKRESIKKRETDREIRRKIKT